MKKLLFLIAVFFLIIGSSGTISAQQMVTGADGQAVTINDTSRIVTLGGSVTEIVFALGCGPQVVAVDQSSSYPPQVNKLPQAPYVRQLNAEGLLSLDPTLILSVDGSRPQTVLDQIRSTDTPLILVPGDPSVNQARAKIKLIGQSLGKEVEADSLIDRMQWQLNKADSLRQSISMTPTVMFVLSFKGNQSMMVAGQNTSADAMIKLAGGKNVFTEFSQYKTVSPEAITAANPDIILMMSERQHMSGGIEKLKQQPDIRLTNAGKNDRFIAMEGNFLLGFGPRTGKAVLKLMKKLHPELQNDE